MPARKNQKPWPMKWVVLAIVAFVALYTALTLFFRKPGKAYEPYHDSRARETAQRLKSAGFKKIEADADRPAEPQRRITLNGAPANVEEAPGGLPLELRESLIDAPHLPSSFTQVRAAAEANPLLPYVIQFTCALPDHKQLLSSASVYVRDEEVAIVTDFEKIEGKLLARTTDSTVEVTIPPGTLPAGNYRVTLVGSGRSKAWHVQVH